ncbi:ATP-binding protein [Paracandidimonas soli]|uniref:Virulence sensor protein BvgS n=2 Tax=Paracandidimonas soli TaxID=1917182 RepID=A0A4R3VD76_9BURK|nr:ATP-binding protein [Paracandidimonas soli]TCV01614.1 two-component system sensor histidine kinase TorS [Paracandidimonas soli]
MKHTLSGNTQALANSGIARRRFGIREKLALGLILSALGIALVAVVGWVSFQRVVDSQQTILAETMPDAEAMHALVRGNARLAALAPQMNRASDTVEVSLLRASLENEMTAMRARIDSLKSTHVEQELIARLRQTYGDLSDTVTEMTQAIVMRLTLSAERDRQLRSHRATIRDMEQLSENQADNAMARLVSVLTSSLVAGEELRPSVQENLIDIDLDHLERMYELRLAVHNLSSLIERLQEFDDEGRLEAGRADYARHLQTMRRRLLNVQDPGDHSTSRRLYAHLASLLDRDGVFSLRARELALSDRTDRLQTSLGQQTARLDALAGELIMRSGQMLASATAKARDAVSSGMLAFGTMAVLLMLLSCAMLFYVLRRHIFSRLKKLESATLDLADGQRDVFIDLRGDDELSSLAHALSRFRDNALERDRLARELEQERENLEQEVAQRTAQLRKANEALAREMQEHATARTQAEQANRSKTAFLGVMSHELRTPMIGVLGTLELLDDSDLEPWQRQLTAQMRTAATLLLEILEDMLSYAQYEVSRPQIDHGRFRLRALLDDILAVQGARAQEKGLALTENIATDVPAALFGDRRKLAQVLLNLVGNAIKFTDDGVIEICVEVRERAQEHCILAFSVIDSGIGIPREQQASLFEPFVQGKEGRSQHGGTGLGLAVCRRLVEAMGGSIWMDSSPGEGTTVSFALPLKMAQAETEVLPPRSKQERKGGVAAQRILLVEDDAVTRMVANRFLASTGHAVEAADSAAHALRAFERRAFDLALIDMHLPDGNGLDLMARLRALPGKETFPVILMSAHVSEAKAGHLLAAGCDAYLGKPFRRERLADVIVQVMEARIGGDEAQEPSGAAGGLAPETVEQRSEPAPACGQTWGNLDFLREEAEALGADVLWQIADAFQRQSQESMTALEAAISTRDRDACRYHVHRLRGSAANLGLERLAAQAAALEAGLMDGTSAEAAWTGEAQALCQAVPAALAWLSAAVTSAARR